MAEGSVDVEQRGWRRVSRGGQGRVVAVTHWGHCCPGTAGVVLKESGGKRGIPVSPATAKGLFVSRRE